MFERAEMMLLLAQNSFFMMAQPIRSAISTYLDMLYLWGVHKSSSFGRNLDVHQLFKFINGFFGRFV